jgi:tRNA threonylcarbamoyl adenosine modification protein YeaZ
MLKSYALALHTSSSQLGLCLSNFAEDISCKTWDLERELSIYLHEYLREFISPNSWDNLEFIAVAKGPGSFTSTRQGVVTARVIAQQLEIPLFAISSLAAFAWSKKKQIPSNFLIALEMAATREQLYGGIYQIKDSDLLTYLPDTLTTPEIWEQTLDKLDIPYQRWEAPANLGTTVSSLLELAYHDWQQGNRPHWSEALPFYGVPKSA